MISTTEAVTTKYQGNGVAPVLAVERNQDADVDSGDLGGLHSVSERSDCLPAWVVAFRFSLSLLLLVLLLLLFFACVAGFDRKNAQGSGTESLVFCRRV